MAKKRLDELLVERQLAKTVDQAKRYLMAGIVFSEQERLDKPGMKVDDGIPLSVKQPELSYVSRGGLKLEKAITAFNLSLANKTVIDIGSSTGGFTDCALQHGARLSYAIDVGYNQLDWKLRQNPRVVVMERTNFRYVTEDMLTEGKPDFACIDVSFISLRLIFPVLKNLLCKQNDVIALIKPQFEARKDEVGTGGIVRDPLVHLNVLERLVTFATEENFVIQGITHSPITGGHGNIEFLAHFKVEENASNQHEIILEDIVEEAHRELIKR